MYIAIVFKGEQAPIKHAVESWSEHESVEGIQSLIVFGASMPGADVASDEEALIFYARDATPWLDDQDIGSKATLADPCRDQSFASGLLNR